MLNGPGMTIICDTNVLIFDALTPQRLSHKAVERLVQGEERGDLACADISLWEIAMLLNKGRVRVDTDIKMFLRNVISARKINVPPITIEIAELSQHIVFDNKDPADRLIAATAMYPDQYCSQRTNDCMRSMPSRPVW